MIGTVPQVGDGVEWDGGLAGKGEVINEGVVGLRGHGEGDLGGSAAQVDGGYVTTVQEVLDAKPEVRGLR